MLDKSAQPRTLLAQIIQDSDRTIEEHCSEFIKCARKLGERDATLSIRQLARWMKGEVADARKPARRVAREVWGHSFEELMGEVGAGPEQLAPYRVPTVELGPEFCTSSEMRSVSIAKEIEMAADEASRFVRRAGIKVTSELLDQLESDVRAMAFEYMKRPPYAIFRQLAAVRSEVFGILDRHPRPEYIRDLYRIAGRASALLAHASNDLGHPDAADSHARTALLCADLSGDRRLATYILWVQSSISYWRGDYREAAGIAHAGRAMSTHPDDSMRLASQEARALAIIGKQDDAISALELVADVRGQVGVDVDRSGVGVFTFGAGKAAYYSSEARLALGGSANVRRAVLDASDSLELLRLASEDGGSVELLAAARLDLMMALLASSDLEGAAQEAALILSLPSESRTVPVVKRVAAVQRTLGDDEFAVQALAIDIREQMDIFCAYPAARELPSLGMARRGRGL